MLAILNSLNAHNFPLFQPFLMIRVSKFMAHRALSDKPYLLLGLLSPLSQSFFPNFGQGLFPKIAGKSPVWVGDGREINASIN